MGVPAVVTFLDQWKGENDRRKDFMINFHESGWPDRVSNPVPLTPKSDVRVLLNIHVTGRNHTTSTTADTKDGKSRQQQRKHSRVEKKHGACLNYVG